MWILIALGIAAAAAAVTTGVMAATGKYDEGGFNDAFGDWFKYTIMNFAAGSVGGAAAGPAAGAAEGAAATASETAAAQAAEAGVSAGVDTAAGIGTGALDAGLETAAMTAEEAAMSGAEMTAAEGLGQGATSAFDAVPEVGLSAADTSGLGNLAEEAPSIWDNTLSTAYKWIDEPTEEFLKMLDVPENEIARFANNDYYEAAKDAVKLWDQQAGHEQEDAQQKAWQQQIAETQAWNLSGAGDPWKQKQSFNQADIARQESEDWWTNYDRLANTDAGFTGGIFGAEQSQQQQDLWNW